MLKVGEAIVGEVSWVVLMVVVLLVVMGGKLSTIC